MNEVTDTASPATEATATAKAKTSAEVVTMKDGSTREFVGKRRMLKESIFPEGGLPQVRLDFRNGETRTYQITPELLNRFAAHGAEQKLGDATAGTEDTDDMVLDVDALIERLNKGEWNIQREAGFAGTSVLLKALVEFSQSTPNPRTEEQVKEYLKTKTPADKQALRASGKIKPIVDRLEAEKIAKNSKVNADELLGTL